MKDDSLLRFHADALNRFALFWESPEAAREAQVTPEVAAYHFLEHAAMLVRYSGKPHSIEGLRSFDRAERNRLIQAASRYLGSITLAKECEQLLASAPLDVEELEQLEAILCRRFVLDAVLQLVETLADDLMDDIEVVCALGEAHAAADQIDEALDKRPREVGMVQSRPTSGNSRSRPNTSPKRKRGLELPSLALRASIPRLLPGFEPCREVALASRALLDMPGPFPVWLRQLRALDELAQIGAIRRSLSHPDWPWPVPRPRPLGDRVRELETPKGMAASPEKKSASAAELTLAGEELPVEGDAEVRVELRLPSSSKLEVWLAGTTEGMRRYACVRLNLWDGSTPLEAPFRHTVATLSLPDDVQDALRSGVVPRLSLGDRNGRVHPVVIERRPA